MRFDPGLRHVSEKVLRTSLRYLREHFHRFHIALLRLEAARIGVELDWFREFRGVIPDGFGFVGFVHGFDDVGLSGEILKAFLGLNGKVSPLQRFRQGGLLFKTITGRLICRSPEVLLETPHVTSDLRQDSLFVGN